MWLKNVVMQILDYSSSGCCIAGSRRGCLKVSVGACVQRTCYRFKLLTVISHLACYASMIRRWGGTATQP